MKKKTQKIKIPVSLKPLLWSYNTDVLDLDHDRDLIIRQILEYGNLDQWRWMIQRYGKKRIQVVLSQTPQTQFRPSLVQLVSKVFNVKMPHVRRVPHKRW